MCVGGCEIECLRVCVYLCMCERGNSDQFDAFHSSGNEVWRKKWNFAIFTLVFFDFQSCRNLEEGGAA